MRLTFASDSISHRRAHPLKIRIKTSHKFVAAFLVGGVLGLLVAEHVPDSIVAWKTITVIRSPISPWWHYLTNPFLLFELLQYYFRFRLRVFMLGGTIGCVILLLAPILFGSGVPPTTRSKETEKYDY